MSIPCSSISMNHPVYLLSECRHISTLLKKVPCDLLPKQFVSREVVYTNKNDKHVISHATK